ncbi:hypothetical protein DNTS_003707 [Danionella cerebrum]|uniref:Protein Flattop n=1 Tax=Danionella cerebrum TaxID=2873325 RepID=A0A553QLQ3_9TELE|nr:hypothetical protein DNTS_003707 [Danionella translucida]
MSSSYSANQQQSPWPAFQGTWDLPNHIPPVSLNLTARSQEGQDRLRRWGQINISRKHGASGGAGAFIRSPHDLVEANVEQALEHPCDQDKPERSTSQQSQNQPIPTEEKQCMSRASQKAPSRPATQENQGQLRPATQNCRTTSQPK